MFKSLLDPDFKYRNAASTDLRKTFERIRRERQREDGSCDDGKAKVVARIANGQRLTARSRP